jgi:hypothetical protein
LKVTSIEPPHYRCQGCGHTLYLNDNGLVDLDALYEKVSAIDPDDEDLEGLVVEAMLERATKMNNDFLPERLGFLLGEGYAESEILYEITKMQE